MRACSTLLVFPPTWTLSTGAPHLALPLLRSSLEKAGFSVDTWDLNSEFAAIHAPPVLAAEARSACIGERLEAMNEPFFRSEDPLQNLAKNYDGRWDAQVGFESNIVACDSSSSTLGALDEPSPFREWYRESVVPRIATANHRLIGIAVAAAQQMSPALQLCDALRKAGFDGFIVLGGNTISRLWEELKNPKLFSLCHGLLRFQGETALVALATAIECGGPLGEVPGLMWCNEGRMVENDGQLPVNVQSTGTPDFAGLPVGKYWGENYLTVVAARGCYYGRCNFCAIPYGWGGFTGVREPRLVLDDICRLTGLHGIRRFKFVDEALTPQFMKKFAQLLTETGVRIEWEGYTRLDSTWYETDFVRLLARSGFRKGYFGLELLPSRGRDLMNKGDIPRPASLLRVCAEAGVKVHFFCMVGFPGTGVAEAEDTVRFIVKNSALIDTADIFPWVYAKHTRVPGVRPILDPRKDWALEFDHTGTEPGSLSSSEIRRLAVACEDIIWEEAPRLLHPTYRLIAPWTAATAMVDARDVSRIDANIGQGCAEETPWM